jgi:hypothetical protein
MDRWMNWYAQRSPGCRKGPRRVSDGGCGQARTMAKKSALEAMTRNPTVQVVAAGAVASGGALAAGKLVRDRVVDRSTRRRTRFRLARLIAG